MSWTEMQCCDRLNVTHSPCCTSIVIVSVLGSLIIHLQAADFCPSSAMHLSHRQNCTISLLHEHYGFCHVEPVFRDPDRVANFELPIKGNYCMQLDLEIQGSKLIQYRVQGSLWSYFPERLATSTTATKSIPIHACRQLDHAGGRLGMCPFLNASVCHPTVEMSRLGHSILLAIYNPLGWPRTEGVRVPLDTGFTSNWTVTGAHPCFLRMPISFSANILPDQCSCLVADDPCAT